MGLFALAAFLIAPIPPDIQARMRQVSWHAGCPVEIADLRRLELSYLDFRGRPAQGKLIVHKDVAEEVTAIFRDLFQHQFRIERMEPVEAFGGDDDRSMAANNTSAFNCRDITGQPGKFSNHSWGRAVDLNPLTNPYVKGEKVLPPGGKRYLDRSRAYPGGILAGSYVVRLFAQYGWTWGGDWKDRKDYQHFEKPARAVEK
jgi:D-alanyl-D-alanine carboxypeptidase